MAGEGVAVKTVLTVPAEEQARGYLRERSFEDRLVGVIMKASGTLPMDLYSLEQVLGFFAHDNSDAMGKPEAVIQERQLDVAYIAPERLARWIREIVGDPELADAIEAESAAIEDPYIYPPRMRLMRELVVTRVLQCYDLLGIEGADVEADAGV
jgi:hypothetical protein